MIGFLPTTLGSTLLPKLVGSYEYELNEVFEEFKNISSNNIVDICSAEGYYAVGFALNFKFKKIIAFDISKKARSLLKKMAKLNDV